MKNIAIVVIFIFALTGYGLAQLESSGQIYAKLQPTVDDSSQTIKYIIAEHRLSTSVQKREKSFDIPVQLADTTLCARNPQTNTFMTFTECYSAHDIAAITYQAMSPQEFKQLVIATYERLDRNFELMIGSWTVMHRQQLIEEIDQESTLGQMLVAVERVFLDEISRRGFAKEIKIQTNADGGIDGTNGDTLPIAMTIESIKLTWTGAPNSFQNFFLDWNGTVLFNKAAVNGTVYPIGKKVNQGAFTSRIKAVGGPKSTTVTFIMYMGFGLAGTSRGTFPKEIKLQTDANGCIDGTSGDTLPINMNIQSIKLSWTGAPDSFQNFYVDWNNVVLYNNKAVNGTSYTIGKPVSQGAFTSKIKAVGGPKNTTVTFIMYMSW